MRIHTTTDDDDDDEESANEQRGRLSIPRCPLVCVPACLPAYLSLPFRCPARMHDSTRLLLQPKGNSRPTDADQNACKRGPHNTHGHLS